MRWKDRRCVSQSCRFCGSCLCLFLLFPVLCIGHTLQQSFQQSYSAVLFGTTQQVNTGKRLLLSLTILYFRILEILYVCTNKKPSCALDFQQRDNLNYNLKKMKVACPTFKYYAHLPDTCNYVKIKQFYETIERKVLHQKLPPLEF